MNVLGEIIPIVPVSGWLVVGGLLLTFFRLLWTEALATRRTVEDLRKQRDEWKAAHDKLLENNNLLVRQADRYQIIGETSVHLLRTAQQAKGEETEDG